MKMMFTQLTPRPDPVLAAHTRAGLEQLARLIKIDRAHIALRQNRRHPPFEATAHLEVPGPDLRASELAYTQRAALDRLLANLTKQIRLRKTNRGANQPGRALRANRPHQSVSPR